MAVLAIMAWLWDRGEDHEIYYAVLRFWDVTVGFSHYLPFLDTHAVLSALQCHRVGIDVFVQNPCDALGRPHNYSPVWFALAYTGLGNADVPAVGTALVVAYFIVVSWMASPKSAQELLLYVLAVFSTASVFAMERGNADLLLFCLIVVSCAAHGSPRARLFTYGALFLGALLKFYPLAAFAAALRERVGRFFLIAISVSAAWALFVALSWQQLRAMLPNIPHAEPLQDAFASRNFFVALEHLANRVVPGHGHAFKMTCDALYLAAVFLSISGSAILSIRLGRAGIMPLTSDRSRAFFIVAGFIVVGAFFAGQNAPYRAIWLMPLLPLLMEARRDGQKRTSRQLANCAIAATLILMWFEFFHQAVGRLSGSTAAQDLAAFLVREPLWWIYVTGMLTLLWLQLAQSYQSVAAKLWLRLEGWSVVS